MKPQMIGLCLLLALWACLEAWRSGMANPSTPIEQSVLKPLGPAGFITNRDTVIRGSPSLTNNRLFPIQETTNE